MIQILHQRKTIKDLSISYYSFIHKGAVHTFKALQHDFVLGTDFSHSLQIHWQKINPGSCRFLYH